MEVARVTALLPYWQELTVPDGWRAEIMGEAITLAPPPGGDHNRIAAQVSRALAGTLPDELGSYQWLGLAVPLRNGLFVPDLVVVPRAEVSGLPDSEPVPAARALLVVEITSHGSADTDRTEKRRGYAHAPVPLYLLIDRFHEDGPSVSLFSEPENGGYRQMRRIPFGKTIGLPDPFQLMLDTAEF